MKLNTTLLTIPLGLALTIGAPQAYALAFNLNNYNGSVDINFQLFTASCDSHTGNCNGNNTQALSSLDLDYNTTLAGPGNNTLNETTFGVGQIASLTASSGQQVLWSAGKDNEELLLVLYGVAAPRIQDQGKGDFNFYEAGCQGGLCDGYIHVDVWKIAATAFNGFEDPSASSIKADGRIGFSEWHNVTDLPSSELVLKMNFVPGISTDPTASLLETIAMSTLPLTGNGSFLADCVLGTPACSGVNGINFNTNGQTMNTDFFGQFKITSDLSASAGANGWEILAQDPILTATQVSEPGMLFLFGSGLLGLAAIRRTAR